MSRRKTKAPSKLGKPLNIGDAEPGYYKTRIVSGGPWVPCRVFEQDGVLGAERDGKTVEMAGNVPQGWPWHPSNKSEFDYLTATRAWTEIHDPADPMANPTKRIDIRSMKVPL